MPSMNTTTHRDLHPFADLFDWLEAPLATFRPVTARAIRVEAYLKDGYYVARAELPGVDPERDIEVTVADGTLTITANRKEGEAGSARSEFRYGSFSRRIPLPLEADADHAQASYDQGILEVVVALKKQAGQSVKHVPVRPLQHIKPT
jgi:HSP20 family protein